MLWCDLFCIFISVSVKYLRWRFLVKIINGTERKLSHGVLFSPYFPVFSPNTGKYGPEKTRYLDPFHGVGLLAMNHFHKRPIIGV